MYVDINKCLILFIYLQVDKPQIQGLSYNTKDKWEIPKSSIHLQAEIGHGQFG